MKKVIIFSPTFQITISTGPLSLSPRGIALLLYVLHMLGFL